MDAGGRRKTETRKTARREGRERGPSPRQKNLGQSAGTAAGRRTHENKHAEHGKTDEEGRRRQKGQ